MTTEGKLDASVAIYTKENSTISRIGCQSTRRGRLFAEASLDKGEFLIRVSENTGSAPGSFRLRFSGVLVEPKPPGTALPASGKKSGTLDALTNPFVQVSRRLAAGHDYRVRVLAGNPSKCDVRARPISPHGATRYLACRDYAMITPTPRTAGRWTVSLIAGGATSDALKYSISITPPGADDLAPGKFIGAFGKSNGSVSGRGPDAQDVFRFDVTKRAEVTLRLRSKGSMHLRLRTESGRAVTSTEIDDDIGQIRTRLKPGRFYLIVDAAHDSGGRYSLSRLTGVITSTTVSWDGQGSKTKSPGGSSTVNVNVDGATGGRATATLERFDPQFGWRYWSRRKVSISGGRGSFSVDTSKIGRYRVKATYAGSRNASPSHARHAAYLRVLAPLSQ